MSDNPAVDREQLATVLEQIADHSSAGDIRGHVRQVCTALRGNGVIFLNGPPQQKMSGDDDELDRLVRQAAADEITRMTQGWDD